MEWTPDTDKQLEWLWTRSSLTATQIAKEIGAGSKNEVMGRVIRLNLPRRKEPELPRKADGQKQRQAEFRKMLGAKREARPTVHTVQHDQCRWPMGNRENGDLFFCGEPRDPAYEKCFYCQYHRLVSARGTQAAAYAMRFQQAAE